MSTETITSPGIGVLNIAAGFSVLGGCVIDLLGNNGKRATAQISARSMFKGWQAGYTPTSWPLSPPVNPWLMAGQTTFDGAAVGDLLGGGIQAANLRITLEDGDSGSPNPVYAAMFGTYPFPYLRATAQPANYDFDGGHNLFFGFEDVDGNPVSCGYMGECTTYRLDAAGENYDTFTGFPGVFALTDAFYGSVAKPAHYMTPVQPGAPDGVWPVTGWFPVPDDKLDALYASVLAGRIRVGVNDALSAGDQYYDFTLGLGADVLNIPLLVTPGTLVGDQFAWLDLWVWRQLHQFDALTQDLNFPPGFQQALLYALAVEMFPEFPAAAKKYDLDELMAEADDALRGLEILNTSDAVAMEPPV
jgi:hypothetical protein